MNGSCKYLAGTCAALIHEYHYGEPLIAAETIATEVFTRTFAAFCIDNKLSFWQEFVDHLDSNVHVATTIAAKVNDDLLHSLHIEVAQSFKHFVMGFFSEVLDVNVASLFIYHKVSINAFHRNVASYDCKVLQVCCSVTFDAEFDLRSLLASEVFHHRIRIHSDKGDCICCDDAVTSQNANPFAWTSMNDGRDIDGVFFHCELYANATKGAFQVFVCFLCILWAEIAAVRVEFAEYLWHSILDKCVHIDRINIVVVDELQEVANLA